MVNGARRWVVIAACGQWILAGGRSQAVGGRRGCRLYDWIPAGIGGALLRPQAQPGIQFPSYGDPIKFGGLLS